uniref:Uncharacterized protein n=1 Tax=Arundo donax TaxID=35708 RepID=A0A0A9CRA1_ARUDO
MLEEAYEEQLQGTIYKHHSNFRHFVILICSTMGSQRTYQSTRKQQHGLLQLCQLQTSITDRQSFESMSSGYSDREPKAWWK